MSHLREMGFAAILDRSSYQALDVERLFDQVGKIDCSSTLCFVWYDWTNDRILLMPGLDEVTTPHVEATMLR